MNKLQQLLAFASQQFSKLAPEMRRINLSYMRRQMQRRIDRVVLWEKRTGIDSPALNSMRDKGYLTQDKYGERLIGIKNMSDKEMLDYTKELQRFGSAKTSTSTGFYESMIEQPRKWLASKTGQNLKDVTTQEVRDFWNKYGKVKKRIEQMPEYQTYKKMYSYTTHSLIDDMLKVYTEKGYSTSGEYINDVFNNFKKRMDELETDPELPF